MKFKTYEDVKKYYTQEQLCTLCNIKQIVFYAKHGCQPLILDEGWDGKLLAIYDIEETKPVWEIWKNRPH